MKIKNLSYINNIKLVAFSESIEENYLILKNTTEKLLQLQDQNNIQFNIKKTKLIHFHTKRLINNSKYPVIIKNNLIKLKNLVR